MKKLKLFLISQTTNEGYDTYDSAVVCAVDAEQAKMMPPRENMSDGEIQSTWTTCSNVLVKYLGEAADGIEVGVVCASFNAG